MKNLTQELQLIEYDFILLSIFDDYADQHKEGIRLRPQLLKSVEKWMEIEYKVNLKDLYYYEYKTKNFKKCFNNATN